MAVLAGGAVSYERGTPVADLGGAEGAPGVGRVLEPREPGDNHTPIYD